jgi:hypothetical protein
MQMPGDWDANGIRVNRQIFTLSFTQYTEWFKALVNYSKRLLGRSIAAEKHTFSFFSGSPALRDNDIELRVAVIAWRELNAEVAEVDREEPNTFCNGDFSERSMTYSVTENPLYSFHVQPVQQFQPWDKTLASVLTMGAIKECGHLPQYLCRVVDWREHIYK